MYRKLVLLVSFVLVLGLASTARANLVAYYEFENNADDSVGSKNGTASGDPTYAAAVYDLGIELDGDGDYITVTDGGVTEFEDGSFSISFWMKTPNDFNYNNFDPNQNFRQVFINGKSGTGWNSLNYTDPRYEFRFDSYGGPQFWLSDGYEFESGQNSIGSGHRGWYNSDWIHVTVIRDREPIVPFYKDYGEGPLIEHQLRIYINGSQIEEPTEDITDNIKSIGEPLVIGAGPTEDPNDSIGVMDPNTYFKGMLDDLRFYDHVLADDEIVKLARPDWMVATNPSPRNKERAVDEDADLSWLAGDDANGHDVYFGTSLSDVNTASRTSTNGVLLSTNQAGASYTLSTLSKNKSYYWRIDEVNDSNIAQWPGELWSLTTRGTPLVEPNLIGWWRFDGDGNDYSGYGSHATLGGNASYGSGKFGGGLQLTEYSEDETADDYVDCGNGTIFDLTENFTLMAWILKRSGQNRDEVGLIAKGANAYRLNLDDTDALRWKNTGLMGGYLKSHWDYHYGGEWRHIAGVYDGSTLKIYIMGVEEDDTSSTTGLVNINKAPVFIGSNVEKINRSWPGKIDDVRIYNRVLTESQIATIMDNPGYPIAYAPFPEAGSDWAKDPNGDLLLTWSATGAVSYDVYFGANEVDVTEADDPEVLPGRGNVAPKEFDIGAVETFGFGKTYYWRVDVVNEPNITKGSVWHFTVADYLLIDDFESYNTDDQVKAVWHEGGGGYVKINTAEYHEGERSMKFIYYNDVYKYVEANNTYGTAQDWTQEDVKALTLYFLATGANNGPDKLYVELVDNEGHAAMVIHPDVNAITEQVLWQEWNIDLQDFKYPAQPSANDVNLANLKSVVIGIGTRGGSPSGASGVVSFDDIRLYRSRCVPAYGPVADFTGDCNVDYQDVNALQRDWLDTAVAPNDSNLLGYWRLDGNGDDSSGNGNDGTRVGDTVYGIGKSGLALGLYGDYDYMTVGNDSSFEFTGPFTVSAWIRRSGKGGSKSQTIVAKGGSSWRLYTRSRSENIEFSVDGLDTPDNPDPNDPEQSASADLDVEDNEWHHVAGVYDGSYIYAYADGVPDVLDINDALPPDTDQNDVWFGMSKDKDTDSDDYREWEGYIDEVRIYNYALSESEIDYLAEMPKDLTNDDKINFQDYAEVGKAWLVEQKWP